MGIAVYRRFKQQTFPRIGQGLIEWGHPLARDLVFASVMFFPDLVTGRPNRRLLDLVTGQYDLNGPHGGYLLTQYGFAAVFDDATQNQFGDRTIWNPNGRGASMLVFANGRSEANVRALLAKGESSGDYSQVALYTNMATTGAASAGRFGGYMRQSAANSWVSVSNSTSMVDGAWHQFGFAAAPGDSQITLYRDGVSVAVDTAITGTFPAVTNAMNLEIASRNYSLVYIDCMIFAYYWTRGLRPDEFLWLKAEPYAFISPIRSHLASIAFPRIADWWPTQMRFMG